jgi:hypothetical protein
MLAALPFHPHNGTVVAAARRARKGVTVTETRTLTFTGARDDQLAGRLDLPDGKPRAVVLVAHC